MLFQTSERYFHEVLEESKIHPVLVDFYASWCAPCRMLAPQLDAFSEKFAEQVSAYSVNTDTEKALAERYTVQELPTVLLFRNAEPCERWEKQISLEEIQKKIRLS